MSPALAGGFLTTAPPGKPCGPVLRDIFQLAEQQGTQYGQKLLRCGACAKCFYFRVSRQHQKQHMGEKPFIGSVDKASLVKNCNFQESWKPFTCRELGKDFLILSGHLQQQATHSQEKPNKISECGVTYQRRKNHYTWGECKKAFNPQNTPDQDQGVHTGRQCFCVPGPWESIQVQILICCASESPHYRRALHVW